MLRQRARDATFFLTAFVAMWLVAGCGSGGDNTSNDDLPAGGPTIGASCTALPPAAPPRLAALSAAELAALANETVAGRSLMQLVGAPVCGVDVHYLNYNTVGGAGERTTASAAMLVPKGDSATCRGPRPIVLYGHGTTFSRGANTAAIRVNGTGRPLAIAYAGHGYIVVAPNYAGYDCSGLPYHPYLNAQQQSQDMMDALAAARRALPTSFAPDVRDSGKLFVSGYSEGGHVAMATHRALEASGAAITASAPMSGPYALLTSIDMSARGEVSLGSPPLALLVATSFQRAYGDLYPTPADIYEDRYASGIESLLPSLNPDAIFAQGRLPEYELYSDTPPAPQHASLTPPTTPAANAARYALGFGPNHLIRNSARLGRLQDAEAHPDGTYPVLTTGLPAPNPQDASRRAYKANDLRTFVPAAPMLLCGGAEDPVVPFRHVEYMQQYWSAVRASPPVTVLDVAAVPAGPYADLQQAFASARAETRANAIATGATDNGDRAVLEAYHAPLVSTYCFVAVRRYFDAF